VKKAAITAVVAGLAIALPGATLAVPGHADARVYLKRFRVADMGANIKWGVTICSTGSVRVRAFTARLESEDGYNSYSRHWRWNQFNGADCERWTVTAPDIWSEGVWYSRLTVVLGNGVFLSTSYRALYIS
jgi:hypothetical protein